MTKDWVQRVGHSPIRQILLQIVMSAVMMSSPSAVLLGCCRLKLISLSSMIVLQPPFLCKGPGGRLLCLSGDSSVLMDLRWPCDCTAQISILSIGSVSVILLRGIFLPQWGAADAEIKVPSGENTELKRSPFKAWSRSVYSHTCCAYCQRFLSCSFLHFRSIHLHFFQNLSRFFPALAVANTWFLCRPAE